MMNAEKYMVRMLLDKAESVQEAVKKETGYYAERVTYLAMVKKLLSQQKVDPKDLSRLHCQLLCHVITELHDLRRRKKNGTGRPFPKWEKYTLLITEMERILRNAVLSRGIELSGSAPELLPLLKKELLQASH